MATSRVSADSKSFGTEVSNFLRAAHEMVRYRPHLNPCRGGESAKRKKIAGERPISLEEVRGLLINARKDGERCGCPAEAVAHLTNALILDTLPEGAEPDVLAVPVGSEVANVGDRREEELAFAVATAELMVTVDSARGPLDINRARSIESAATKVMTRARRLVVAAKREVR